MSTLLANLGVSMAFLLFGGPDPDPPPVVSVSDISQEFSFYMDGRFHRQYLEDCGGWDVRNWGSLSKLDLEPFNLLLLTGGNPRIPYDTGAQANVWNFVQEGGTVLLMADGTTPDLPAHVLAERFGITLSPERAVKPLRGVGELDGETITFRNGNVLDFGDQAEHWTPLVVDKLGRPVLAAREYGEGGIGDVVIGSRGLFGRKPDASDPINAEWVTPMLQSRAVERERFKRPRVTRAELSRDIGPLTLEYHDGTEQFAEAIYEVYKEVRPHLIAITGCEQSPGMIKSMLILPTGGGGFSSGVKIAIGAWWGNYPEKRYPMVELIAHEAGHSWVLPHAEPLWNEPIATWLGIKVGQRLGMPEADEKLGRQIAKARRYDPELTTVDPQSETAHRDLIWGKSYFVFEELERNHGPKAMAKYFAAKRSLVGRDRPDYTMDDCVAVWSRGVGEDLFPWFRSLAFDVDAERTDLWPGVPIAE